MNYNGDKCNNFKKHLFEFHKTDFSRLNTPKSDKKPVISIIFHCLPNNDQTIYPSFFQKPANTGFPNHKSGIFSETFPFWFLNILCIVNDCLWIDNLMMLGWLIVLLYDFSSSWRPLAVAISCVRHFSQSIWKQANSQNG